MKIIDLVESIDDFNELIEKVSRKMCRKLAKRPPHRRGASNSASCKSQGLIPRDSKVKVTLKSKKGRKKRVKIGSRKIKGKKYGGPLPDYS